MSARKAPETVWDVQFAYRGRTRNHWRSVLIVEGTQREAERQAVELYSQPDQTAVDLLVVPAEISEGQP